MVTGPSAGWCHTLSSDSSGQQSCDFINVADELLGRERLSLKVAGKDKLAGLGGHRHLAGSTLARRELSCEQ